MVRQLGGLLFGANTAVDINLYLLELRLSLRGLQLPLVESLVSIGTPPTLARTNTERMPALPRYFHAYAAPAVSLTSNSTVQVDIIEKEKNRQWKARPATRAAPRLRPRPQRRKSARMRAMALPQKRHVYHNPALACRIDAMERLPRPYDSPGCSRP